MKFRSGFVTNSSSSSFVVGFKQDGLNEIENTLDKVPAIFKSSFLMFKKVLDFDDAITTKEQLDKYFIYEYGYKNQTIEELLEEDEYLQEKYDMFLKHLEKGYGIIEKSVDHYDETMNDLLHSLPKKDDCIILIEEMY